MNIYRKDDTILNIIRIGTRGSKLALWQADFVTREIKRLFPDIITLIKIIKTSGDVSKSSLTQFTNRGIFTKEIEIALQENRIDLGVHSLKDMPVDVPEGLEIGAVTKRDDAHDVLISRNGEMLDDLPQNAVIATDSLRRRAQLSYFRNDFRFVEIRGNVDTRIKKIKGGYADAIVLAAAGLKRLGIESQITQMLGFDIMLPAPGQGVIAIESRSGEYKDVLVKINDTKTMIETTAERVFLKAVGGGCKIPIGCLAVLDEGRNILEIEGGIFEKEPRRKKICGNPLQAQELALSLASMMTR